MIRDPSEMLAAAVAAREHAYAPYSGFFVGAALFARDGRVFTGANIENASYGLSMCAERVALYTAVAAGVREFEAMALTGPDGVLTLPCGACRQVLYEFAPQLPLLYRDGGEYKRMPLAELLPHAFNAQALDAGVADRGIR